LYGEAVDDLLVVLFTVVGGGRGVEGGLEGVEGAELLLLLLFFVGVGAFFIFFL
jgi:hypothetical protein